MKKGKVTSLAVLGTLFSITMSSCYAPTYSTQGNVLTYVNSAGDTSYYTAEELFGTYLTDSTSVSTMFDKVYELIVRNYYLVEPGQETAYATCVDIATARLEAIEEECEDSASSNGTSYDDEFATVLDEYGAVNEDDLYEVLLYNAMKEDFEENFYDDNIDHLRDSKTTDTGEDADGYEGYLEAMSPYHVSHILVNVDADADAHYNGTISEEDAEQIYDVAYSLANYSAYTFGWWAQFLSDDSSASDYGELGIMDKSTSYINEFKLGIYAYEQLYNENTADAASASSIGIDSETQQELMDATGNTTIGTIPYGAFVKLDEYADVTTGYNSTQVNDGDAEYYPRNIYFNKYFNKHNVSVITPNDVASGSYDSLSGEITGETEEGTFNSEYAALPGFQSVDYIDLNDPDNPDNLILCTSEGDPILVVRGGTGDTSSDDEETDSEDEEDSSSGYQGIHFIVINRSPFEDAEVSLSDYYTTYYPGHDNYPTDSEGNALRTYVNYFDESTSNYRTRAEEVYNTITGFDSEINYYIFEKYFESQKLQFNDESIGEAIFKWIETQRTVSEYEEQEEWEDTWREYIEYLEQQTAEREKNLSEVCAISYQMDPSDSTYSALWENGGPCDDRR